MMSARNVLTLAVAAVVASLLPMLSHTAGAARIATSGRPLTPAIAYAPRSNSYLMVWAEDRNLGTGLDLYALRLTSTGIAAGGLVPLVVAAGDQSDPALAWSDRNDSFLVVFTQTGPDVTSPTPGTGSTPPPFPSPPGPPVPLRSLVDSSSAVQPPIPPPIPPPPIPSPGPSVTPVNTSVPPPPPPPGPTATGGPPVPPPVAAGQRDIHGLWVSEGGIRLTSPFPMIASPADDTYPSLAYRRTTTYDKWALVWREVTGTDPKIVSMELTGFGRYLTITSGKAIIAAGGDHGRPSVALERSTGEYLAVWSETQKGSASRDILGRRLNANAFPRGRVLRIVAGSDDLVHPSVASAGDSEGYLVAWEQRAVGQAPDIRLRRLNRNGIPLRAAYTIAGGPPFSFGPNIPTTDRPTRLLVWVDRNAASDHALLGSEITRDGRPIGPVRLLVQGGAGPGAVTPIAPPAPFPTLPPLPPFPPVP